VPCEYFSFPKKKKKKKKREAKMLPEERS